MNYCAWFGLTFACGNIPHGRGGRHKHLASSGAGPTQWFQARHHTRASTCAEECRKTRLDERLNNADLSQVYVEFFRHDHGQRRIDALAHLRLGKPDARFGAR